MGISGMIRLKHLDSWGGIDIIDGTEVSGEIERHMHDRDSLGIVESGKRVMNFSNRSMVREAGSVWYIPSGTVHTVERLNIPHAYKVINFNLHDLQRYFNLPIQSVNPGVGGFHHEAECYRAVQMFCRLADEAIPLEAESFLMIILSNLVSTEPVEEPRAIRDHTKIILVRRYLDEYFTRPVFIQNLADIAGWSPFHLEHIFRETVGMPMHQYQKMARIRAGKRLLQEGKAISYVASETGFADQSHFSRAFKEMIGITPGAYLKAYR